MKRVLFLLPLLGLVGGCAGLGQFTGSAIREATRPDVVYVEPAPYYPRWQRRGWW